MKKITVNLSTLVILLNTSYAFADSSLKVENILLAFLNYLTSTPAQILAVLAIATVGYNTLHTGKIPKHIGISIIIGIAILFSASTIFTMLTGINAPV